MEKKFQVTTQGASVTTDDFNVLGETSGLADDRVLSELFRIPTANVSGVQRGIIPYWDPSENSPGHGPFGTVCSTFSASGKVTIRPFRAYIGTQVLESTNALEAWRGMRSGIFVGGATARALQIGFSSNSSGNARWDLVYCAVTPDTAGPSVSRKVKDATSKVISVGSLVTTLVTTVTVGVVTGTPSALSGTTLPARPAVPADSGGVFYIPLAYVRIPNGFVANSTLIPNIYIAQAAPILNLSPQATGVVTCRPCNKASGSGTTNFLTRNNTSGTYASWADTGTRPNTFLPADNIGCEILIIPLEFGDSSTSNFNVDPAGGIIDDKRDWRNCFFEWSVIANQTNSQDFAWHASTNPFDNKIPGVSSNVPGTYFFSGMGQSFYTESAVNTPGGTVLSVDNTQISELQNSTTLTLTCDSIGRLLVNASANPRCRIFILLKAYGPFPSAR